MFLIGFNPDGSKIKLTQVNNSTSITSSQVANLIWHSVDHFQTIPHLQASFVWIFTSWKFNYRRLILVNINNVANILKFVTSFCRVEIINGTYKTLLLSLISETSYTTFLCYCYASDTSLLSSFCSFRQQWFTTFDACVNLLVSSTSMS